MIIFIINEFMYHILKNAECISGSISPQNKDQVNDD